jgi:hypothetical protein
MKYSSAIVVLALISSVDGGPTPAPSLLPYIKSPSWSDMALDYADEMVRVA